MSDSWDHVVVEREGHRCGRHTRVPHHVVQRLPGHSIDGEPRIEREPAVDIGECGVHVDAGTLPEPTRVGPDRRR